MQTVYSKREKGALELLPKYVQCTGMQHGALGERNKDSTVSGSLSPVLPHPHIISWKIPDICCNFFSPPPFFSLGIAGTDMGLISRCPHSRGSTHLPYKHHWFTSFPYLERCQHDRRPIKQWSVWECAEGATTAPLNTLNGGTYRENETCSMHT